MTSAANSRVVAQAHNRVLITACARELFLTRGFTATSIAQITTAAGLTTGAFYSNFANKAELTIEVLSDLQKGSQQQLEELLAIGKLPERIRMLREWVDTTLASGWPRLELEFALASRSDPGVVEQEGNRNRAAARSLEASLERLAPTLGDGPVPLRRIAEVILDLAFGLAVRNIIDPQVTADHIFDTINALVATDVGSVDLPEQPTS
ncbi:TetR/AcrR family transcriptional regulator [Actinomycetes bacterium M1A6_2h]